MRIFKKIIAVLSLISIMLTMTACHKKDEIALNIDGINITSALYLNALVEADLEAKQKIDDEMAENNTSTTDVNYLAQKVDGQPYADYVKAKALERCKNYAFYQKLIDNKTITLDDAKKQESDSYASTYWSYYGYSSLLEPNGISLETYKKAMLYNYCSDLYFKQIYGKDGSKAVDEALIKKTMTDKYVLVYTLSETYKDGATDAEKTALKDKYQAYADRLAKGEKYSVIYEEINGKQETSQSTNQTTEQTGPKDQYATVIGDEDTGYASTDYNTVDVLKLNETKLIESEDKTGFTVYQKLDISSDDYYLEALNSDILYLLKEEEFSKSVDAELEKLTVDEKTFAIKRFKVKNIVYPTAQ